jgi:hypothetical protein
VPQVGEKIYYRRARLPTQVVQNVSYLVDQQDGLIGAMVTVAWRPMVSASETKPPESLIVDFSRHKRQFRCAE